MRHLSFALLAALLIASCGKSDSRVTPGDGGEGGAPPNAGTSGTRAGEAAISGAAGAPPVAIMCEWDFFTTNSGNEKAVGDSCSVNSFSQETLACPGQFCISRLLLDRWPANDAGRLWPGHCTRHCETDADCGTGARCCEPRPEPLCLPYADSELLQSGCSERCATDHLNCAEGEICCERIGKLCVSDRCSGICPE